MYERLIFYTYHTTLQWLLTIDDQSGWLIRWRLRLTELDFKFKCKKGPANSKADALSGFNLMSKKNLHDDNKTIPSFSSTRTTLSWSSTHHLMKSTSSTSTTTILMNCHNVGRSSTTHCRFRTNQSWGTRPRATARFFLRQNTPQA